MTRAHSKLSPSAAERWLKCPASVKLSQGLKDMPSEAAAQGTVAHSLAERRLRNEITWRDMQAMVGQEVQQSGFTIAIDEEMIGHVEDYVSYAKAVRVGMGGELLVETTVAPAFVDPSLYGTLDVGVLSPDRKTFVVLDFKYGAGKIVDVYKNKQLMIYALGLIAHVGSWPDKVRLMVYQPRVKRSGGPVVEHEVSALELMDFVEELKVGIAEVRADNPRMEAGDWCRFCRAKGVCPAFVEKARELARIEFGSAPTAAALPDAQTLTPEQLSKILDWTPALREWLTAVENACKSRMSAGGEVPGYKMVKGRQGNRRWADEKAAAAELTLKFGNAVLSEPELLSPAKVEKVIKDKELVARLTVRPDGAPALVPQYDPREAICFASAEQEFSSADSTDLLGLI